MIRFKGLFRLVKSQRKRHHGHVDTIPHCHDDKHVSYSRWGFSQREQALYIEKT